jgi:phosphate starvation-inducible membrane PsiE
LIAIFTVISVGIEMYTVIINGKISLTDLLLMFIYAEVLGMVAAFYKYNKIPITIPIFIAITALCRLIILQGKGISSRCAKSISSTHITVRSNAMRPWLSSLTKDRASAGLLGQHTTCTGGGD